MRYYLAELKIPQHFHPTNLHHKKKKIKTILCEDGEYRMVKKNLYKYKLSPQIQPDIIIKKYVNHYTLLSSNNTLVQCDITYRIPYEHIIQEIQCEIYKLHPQSTTKLVIEKIKNKMIDFYFESPHNPQHITLKEDIVSFLSTLK